MLPIRFNLEVFPVSFQDQEIGILNDFTINEEYNSDIFRLGQTKSINMIETVTSAQVELLMTRPQKTIFAVMYKLRGGVDLTVNMRSRGIYKISGNTYIPEKIIKEFAEGKNGEDSLHFVIEPARIEYQIANIQ